MEGHLSNAEDEGETSEREHQTGVYTGVKGVKGCIKLPWARGESRRDGG